MNLPIEIIAQIFLDDLDSLYMLNKECTIYYLKRKINLVKDHTNQSTLLVKALYFDYYSHITSLRLNVTNLKNLERWADFPFHRLINCRSIRLLARLLSENRLLFGKMIRNIRSSIPNLAELRFDDNYPINIDGNEILNLFHDSKLQHIELGDICDSFYLLSKMKCLSSLNLWDPTRFSDIQTPLPNITTLEFSDYYAEEMVKIFSNLLYVFPNLKHFAISSGVLPTPPVLSLIPSSIKFVSFTSVFSDIQYPADNQQFNNLLINIARPSVHSNMSALSILKIHSKTWTLAIGIPVFLIVTNSTVFSDLIHWYTRLFKQFSDYSHASYQFEMNVCANVYFYFNKHRLLKNEKEYNVNGLKVLFSYCTAICTFLGAHDQIQQMNKQFQ